MKNKNFLIGVTLFLLVFGSGCQSMKNEELFTTKYYNSNTLEIVLTDRVKALSAPVSDIYSPIFIFSKIFGQIQFLANGTLVETRSGSKMIITVAHAFPEDRKNSFFYETLPDKKSSFDQGITMITRQDNDDIVVADTGKSRNIDGVYVQSREYKEAQKMSVLGETKTILTSLVDGKQYLLILVLASFDAETETRIKFAIEKQAYPGESGTGFVDENKNLFVLSSTTQPGFSNLNLSFLQMARVPDLTL